MQEVVVLVLMSNATGDSAVFVNASVNANLCIIINCTLAILQICSKWYQSNNVTCLFCALI